tara:strand:- start:13699 stop:16917 length:3219 start_codon:yes stop_codon:yes gene_type:complete
MRPLLILTALLILIPLAGLLALRSEPVFVALAQWAVAASSDLRLELKDPHISLSQGRFSASEVHLYPAGSEGPALVSVVAVSVSGIGLNVVNGNLNGAEIRAQQILLYVSENDDASDPQPDEWLQFLRWLPSSVNIDQVHLITAAENVWIFPLKNVRGMRHDSAQFVATASADYDGEPIEIETNLRALLSAEGITGADVSASLKAPQSDSIISLKGQLNADAESFNYEFATHANYRSISSLLTALKAPTTLSGTLEVNAVMTGDTHGFELKDAIMTLDNMPAYGFEAQGSLSYSRSGESEVRLLASGEMASLEELGEWIAIDIGAFGRTQASLDVTGSLQHPQVENLILTTQTEQGLDVRLSGRLSTTDSGDIAVQEIRVDALAPSLQALEPWLGKIPYEPGPWRASGKITGDQNEIAISQLLMESGAGAALRFNAQGRIGSIRQADETGLNNLQDVDLSVSVQTFDTSQLEAISGVSFPLPVALTADARLYGSGDRLQLTDGHVTAKTGSATLELQKARAILEPESAQSVSDFIASITLELNDTRELSPWVKVDVPALGALNASAQLQQRGNRLELNTLNAALSDNNVVINSKGAVTDLVSLNGVQLATTLSGLDIQYALNTAFEEADIERHLGVLDGRFTLRDTGGQWGLSDIYIATRDNSGPVALSMSGSVDALTGFRTANLAARLAVNDSQLLEALSGLRISTVDTALVIHTTPEQITVNGRSQFENSVVNVASKIDHQQAQITRLQIELDTPNLLLADLGLQAAGRDSESYSPGEQLTETEQKLSLQQLIERLPHFATDISMSVDSLSGENTNVQGLKVHITGEERRYLLREFSMTHGHTGGVAEVRGVIDASAAQPVLSLAGEGVALSVGALSEDLGIETDVKGTLTIRGGLTATGTDQAALLESLSGSVAAAMEEVRIKGAAYDVLATDFLAWIYSGAALENSTSLDCAMARFDLANGVASSDSLYVQSPRMIATGKASINLARQKMDVTLLPRSRTRTLQIPSSVRLKGDMSNPKPTISPIMAAADASAQALMLVPKIAMTLFGVGGKASQQGIQPCQAALAAP